MTPYQRSFVGTCFSDSEDDRLPDGSLPMYRIHGVYFQELHDDGINHLGRVMIRFCGSLEVGVFTDEEMDTMAFNQLHWPEITLSVPDRDVSPQAERDSTKEETASAVASVKNWENVEEVTRVGALVGKSHCEFMREGRITRNANFLASLDLGVCVSSGNKASASTSSGQASASTTVRSKQPRQQDEEQTTEPRRNMKLRNR